MESAGFEERVTADGMHQLLHAALRLRRRSAIWPSTRAWSGLRPATPDGLPVLGETPLEGYFLATGHYRNGILLTPATAR